MKRFLCLLFLVLGVLAFAFPANAGTLYFSEDLNPNGLYSLDVNTGAPTLLGMSGVTSRTVGLATSDTDGVLWGSTFFNINAINEDGSGAVNIGSVQAEGLTYNPDNGKFYGSINFGFFEISTSDFTTEVPLTPAGNDIEGLAYAGDGVIYGLSSWNGPRGVLYSYDIALDSWTELGFTGVPFLFVGLAYNPILDVLYAKGAQDTLLYSINPATATASVIGDTGIVQGGGLTFQSAVPEPTTMLLLATGLVGLAGFRRKFKS